MVLTKAIYNTKKSKFGDNYEQVQFPNGEWYDVEKNSYILAKWNNNGDWIIINKYSELLNEC